MSDAAGSKASLRLPRWLVWTLAAGVLVAYFCMLGRFALGEPDEGRYAEIAREMVELGDWVTPHLNYVKYFEKPPLIYWLTAVSFRLFGMSEFTARVWPALFGVVGIVVASRLGRSMYDAWTGAVAAGVLATTLFYFGLSQVLVLDMPLSALMTVGLAAFWFAYREPARRRRFVLLLYVATALGVLTKGPVAALLTGATIVAFLLLRRELAALRWLLSPSGIVLFFALALPWFVLVSQRNPEFVDFFVVKQHFDRFARPSEHRQPLWFFVPVVFAGMLPWTVFLTFAPRMCWRSLRRLFAGRVSTATVYCTVWSAVIFLFFSLSGSKLATYVLPMFCPAAILLARFFAHVIARDQSEVLHRGFVFLLGLAIMLLLAAAITQAVVDNWVVVKVLPTVWFGATILAAVAAAALWLMRRGAQVSFATLLVGMLVVEVVALTGRGAAFEYRPLGLAVRRDAGPQDQLVTYRHYVQGIPFYARRRTVMVGGWGELDFGSRQGDLGEFFWETDAQLLDAWRSPRRIFLVINRSELEDLHSQMDPVPRQIAAYGKKVVVVNFH